MKKRILTVLLAVCLVVALGTVTAAADGSSEKTGASVALVNGLYYDSLADAVNAIDSEGTIELVGNAIVNTVVNVSSGKSITLDLGSYTIKPSETSSSGKVLRNYGELTIIGTEGGTIDVSNKDVTWCAIENRGQLNILSGNIVGNGYAVRSVLNTATTRISGGKIEVKQASNIGAAVETHAETIISGNAEIVGVSAALRAYGADVTIQDEATLTGQFGVILFNSTSDNTAKAVPSTLTMTGGTITSNGGFALSGNNQESAGCSAEITGGTLKSESETGIYWPMEGELTIGGSAVVEGATAIQARMGEINISGNAVIKGTGAYNNDEPVSGKAAAEGSALLITSQMYGGSEGQYATSPNVTVNITGGTLESAYGNAVTVYNTENTEVQETNVAVTGGELKAAEGKAAVQVTTAKSKSSSELDNYNGTNVLTTSASKTTVTVSADVAVAAVDNKGNTYYYSNAEDVPSKITGEAVYIIDEDTTLPNMPALNAKVTADRTNALVGSTVTLTATTNHETGAVFTYQWYKNGELISGATGKTLEVTENGVYEVFITATIKVDNITYYPIDSASIAYTFSEPTIPDTYDIEIADTANGEVSTSLSNASAGSTITITAEPDTGYSVGSVTVTGPDGRVDVTRVNATTYTFKMPDHDVTVRVYFTDGTSALPFTDVSANQWFYEAVSYVYTNGMMEGDSATTFNPDGQMTRAMFWAVLGRIDGATITGANWVETARSWAMAEGVSDGTNPNDYVTREMMVTMLWRYAGEPASDESLSGYTDAASVSDWAAEAMSWALETGVIEGVTATTLQPQGTATRAQCATIFMRYDMI